MSFRDEIDRERERQQAEVRRLQAQRSEEQAKRQRGRYAVSEVGREFAAEARQRWIKPWTIVLAENVQLPACKATFFRAGERARGVRQVVRMLGEGWLISMDYISDEFSSSIGPRWVVLGGGDILRVSGRPPSQTIYRLRGRDLYGFTQGANIPWQQSISIISAKFHMSGIWTRSILCISTASQAFVRRW